MSDKSYSAINALVDIIAAPGKALPQIRDHTAWLWWPLLISIGLASMLIVYFNSWVDMNWLIEETIRQMPPEARAEAADGVRSWMTSPISTVVSVVAIVVFVFLLYSVLATYLHLANKVTSGADLKWGQWFSLSSWASFPTIFGTLAAFMVLFMADSNQLAPDRMQVFTLNALLIHAKQGEPWFTWGNSFTILNFWVIALLGLGFANWTSSSFSKGLVIAAAPWVLIFGIWALMV